MKYILHTGALGLALMAFPCTGSAQTNTEAAASSKEIVVGSHVLRQHGNSEYSYRNDAYYYEKAWEVAGASKKELYGRVKQWLGGITAAEISRINYDEADKNSISAVLDVPMRGNGRHMEHEHITFLFRFSFEDGKLRLDGNEYQYHGDYDNGVRTRQVATGNGPRNETYLDAKEYDTPLHNLAPMAGGMMRDVYSDFDAHYLKIVRDMKKNVLNDAG